METPKEFLEGYDPQIKEVGYDNYSYTPQQVIDRLEAYRKELVKESDSLPTVSLRQFDSKIDELKKEIDDGYSVEGDDYKRYNWICEQKRAMRIIRNLIFPDAS